MSFGGPKELLALAEVQGNIIRPYHMKAASHLFLEFEEPSRARAWVGAMLPRLMTAEVWPAKELRALNVAFTAKGFRALGMPEATLAEFDGAFRAGMAGRAPLLGDADASRPEAWEAHWRKPIHAMLELHAADQTQLGVEADALEAELNARDAMSVVARQDACRLDKANREHFGFADGIGQPWLNVVGVDKKDTYPGMGTPGGHLMHWHPVALGEFVLGHEDEESVDPLEHCNTATRALMDNGTYLVFRKLEQNVKAYRDFIAAEAAALGCSAEQVGAWMVGRWQDGEPLEHSPFQPVPEAYQHEQTVNDFRYEKDHGGERCPIGAHIRRANPRDAPGFHSHFAEPQQFVSRHRMIRRGITYGADFDRHPECTERGLLFMCCVASIERQFEFVQSQWLGDGNVFGLGDDKDALTYAGTNLKMTIQREERPAFLVNIPAFITTKGGEYFFKPGLPALQRIAENRMDPE